MLFSCFVGLSASAGTLYCVGSGTLNGKALPGNNLNNKIAIQGIDGGNVYQFEVSCTSGGWFKFSTANTTDWNDFNRNGFNVYGKGDNALVNTEIGKILQVWYGSGNDITPPCDGNTYVYTLTVGDLDSEGSLMVTKKQTSYPSSMYLLGTIDGGNKNQDWNIGAAPKATGNNGVYTWEKINIDNIGEGYGYISFAESDNESWNEINKTDRYGGTGPIGNDPLLSSTLAVQHFPAGNGTDVGSTVAWKVAEGTYDVTLNLVTRQVSITPVQSTETYSVYFNNTAKWENVYVYTFKNEVCGEWPGTKLEPKTDGQYQWDYEASSTPSFDGIIFNNGKEDPLKRQTGNLTYQVGQTYNNDGLYEDAGTGTGVYLQGSFNGWSNQPQYEFSVNNNNEYKLSVDLDAGDHELKVFYEGALRGYIPNPEGYDNTIMENKDLLFGYKNSTAGNNFKFTLSQKSTVNFYYKKEYKTYDGGNTYYWTSLVYSVHPKTEYTDRPEALYLYGHVNGGYWKYDNYVVLKKNSSDGKYYAEDVEVSGLWKQKDVDYGNVMGQNRELDKSTKTDDFDLQYVALYTEKAKNDDFDDANKGMYKFGSTNSQNNEDNYTNCRINDLPNNTAKIEYQGARDSNNFIVNGGVYNITVDLENGTITFEEVKEDNKAKVIARTFNWWYGNDEDPDNAEATLITQNTADVEHVGGDYDNHAHHSFVYGNTDQNVIQVGIKTMPEHRLAQQAVYTIWYADTSYKPSGTIKNLKRRAALDEGELDYEPAAAITEENLPSEDFKEVKPNVMDGNGNIIDGDPDAAATTIGSNDLGDNHLLRLNNAGYYIITADVKEDFDGEGYDYDLTPSSLFVTVSPAALEATTEEDALSLAFVNTEDEISITFTIENNATVTKNDMSATFAPKGNASGWVTEVTAENIGSDLFREYESIALEYDNVTYKIDGAYDPNYKATVTISDSEKEGEFIATITPAPPCSGLYELTVTATGNYELNQTFEVNYYPNLVNQYYQKILDNGQTVYKETGFNVNGIPAKINGDFSGTVVYPIIEGDPNQLYHERDLNVSNIYTVGNYLTDVMVYSAGITKPGTQNIKRKAYDLNEEEYWAYKVGNVIDLSALGTGSDPKSMTIYIYGEKNGATTPVSQNGNSEYSFLIDPSTSYTLPTGVESVTVEEDGEAVYYNLQGVKVENPEKGIYVKVQNGKAEKVVL